LPVETGAVIAYLEAKEKKEELPQLLQFYQKLLRIQLKVEQKLASRLMPSLSQEVIDQRIASGISLISFDELALDRALLSETFTEVINAFAEYPDLVGEIPRRLKEPGVARDLLTKGIFKAWFLGAELESVLGEGRNQELPDIAQFSKDSPFRVLLSHQCLISDRNLLQCCAGGYYFLFFALSRLLWTA